MSPARTPAAEYAATRHNAGAWFVDLLQSDCALRPMREEAKFFGYTSRVPWRRRCPPVSPDYIYESQAAKAVAAMASFFSALIRTEFWWPRRTGSASWRLQI
ncbi:aminoacyl-tRNA hydrolase [Escherichia coli]|nr:aminoacyl-tRNA hydrolase [Escherichia coli]